MTSIHEVSSEERFDRLSHEGWAISDVAPPSARLLTWRRIVLNLGILSRTVPLTGL
jgi:hypothetical protein